MRNAEDPGSPTHSSEEVWSYAPRNQDDPASPGDSLDFMGGPTGHRHAVSHAHSWHVIAAFDQQPAPSVVRVESDRHRDLRGFLVVMSIVVIPSAILEHVERRGQTRDPEPVDGIGRERRRLELPRN